MLSLDSTACYCCAGLMFFAYEQAKRENDKYGMGLLDFIRNADANVIELIGAGDNAKRVEWISALLLDAAPKSPSAKEAFALTTFSGAILESHKLFRKWSKHWMDKFIELAAKYSDLKEKDSISSDDNE